MPTQAQIARTFGVSRAYITKLVKKGMPLDSFEAAKFWRATNASKRATTSPVQIAKQLQEEKDSDAPEARARQKKYSAKRPDGYRLPSGDSLKNALNNTIEASEEAFRLLKEAMIEEKDQKISARLAVFNKSSENRFKAESAYREDLERRRILIPLAEAMETARRGYEVILQRLKALPQNVAPRCNPTDPHRAISVLESECTAILGDAQKVYASWSEHQSR
jgi:transcriptional regulator with XRE-family HTH domain